MSKKDIPPAARYERQLAYTEKAAAASHIERQGNYQQAANLWKEAHKLALTEKQRDWCNIRAKYCAKWQAKRER